MHLGGRLVLVLLMVLSCAQLACRHTRHFEQATDSPKDGETSPPSAADIAMGESLYNRYCKLCHAPAAAGYAADNANQLRNKTFLATATTPFLWLGIERGRPNTPMAGFGDVVGGPLSGESIKKIIDYLRSLTPTEQLMLEDLVVAGDPDVGRGVYEAECSGCHGTAGTGSTATSLSNPYFLATASDGFIRHAIEHGRPGTRMQAYGDKLTAIEIDGLTRYIRSWARTVEDETSFGEALPALDQIVINPKGLKASFSNLREGRYVAASEVARALKEGSRIVILDARPTSDWFKAHIPGAFPAPFYDGIAAIAGSLPRDGTWIVAYCACPHAASGKIVDELRLAGFTKTAVLDEGVLIWAERDYPVTIGARD